VTYNKKLPKLLMLITNFGKGGAQRVFFDHATAFSANGLPVEEAVFNADEDVRLYNSELPLHSLDGAGVSKIPGPLGRILSRAKSLKAIVAKEHFEVVISHMDGANWINVLSAAKAKKILVVHGTILHDHDQHPFKQWLRKKVIIPWLYNKADLTVSVSEGIAHELKEICKVKRVTAIPNFFDLEGIRQKSLQPIPEQYEKLFADHPVLITSGRLADQKKQAILPVILKSLRTAGDTTTKLVILGDGPLRDELIQKSVSAGLKVFNVWDIQCPYHENYDVYFLGYIDNPYQYLRRSALFLFPSAWEGFPMALCEAMVTGIPVLSADCPTGPREILAPGTVDIRYSLAQTEYTSFGVLLPMVDKPGCEQEWVAATTLLLSKEGQEQAATMKIAAAARMTDFSKEKIMERWMNAINSL
jgi:glycosyltransferase involved in cell wall biosynthesis